MTHPFANKVNYTEVDAVVFDLGQGTSGTGRIRGLATTGLIDTWIVEIVQSQGIDKGTYPYSCVSIPHPQLKRAERIDLGDIRQAQLVDVARTLLMEWDIHLTRQSARLEKSFVPMAQTIAKLREVVRKAGL